MAPAIASLLGAPRFHTVDIFLRQLDSEFPTHAALNELAQKYVLRNAKGLPLRFVPPVEAGYEKLIYEEARVPTRAKSWHDLFNALSWCAFPRAKALLNRLHIEEMAKQESADRRSTARDVLTLYDESGMVIACADAQLAELLRGFEWKELFWRRRDEVRGKICFHIFGHALHEQFLEPYKGITGKALVVPVDENFARKTLLERNVFLDDAICAYFEAPRALESTQALQPLPALGIPDWWHNNFASYYDDKSYFRPGRGIRGQGSA